MHKIAPPSAFKINPVNPRKITAEQLSRLKRSLQELPQMLELRPVVVDNDHSMTVLGGNMRVLAARELGMAELPYVTADNLTDEQRQRFIIADNVSFGEWEQEMLTAYWDVDQLVDWGVDIPQAADNAAVDYRNDYAPEYKVVVECADEAHQQRIYNQLQEQGEKCKPMTL